MKAYLKLFLKGAAGWGYSYQGRPLPKKQQ